MRSGFAWELEGLDHVRQLMPQGKGSRRDVRPLRRTEDADEPEDTEDA